MACPRCASRGVASSAASSAAAAASQWLPAVPFWNGGVFCPPILWSHVLLKVQMGKKRKAIYLYLIDFIDIPTAFCEAKTLWTHTVRLLDTSESQPSKNFRSVQGTNRGSNTVCFFLNSARCFSWEMWDLLHACSSKLRRSWKSPLMSSHGSTFSKWHESHGKIQHDQNAIWTSYIVTSD